MQRGNYVLIKEGVHDESMPRGSRDALVVDQVGYDEWLVMFRNGAFLKFHESQLEVLSEAIPEEFNEARG